MKYQIKDLQNESHLFANGELFDSPEAVRQQLISFHSIDFDEESEDMKKLQVMTLGQILMFGGWSIIEQTK